MEDLYIHDELVHNKRAARIILPMVFALGKFDSVLDVGCGLGTWLSVCEELGVSDYCGVDGDYVDDSKLTIPREKFFPRDLRSSIQLGRKFDLAICLEVGEHLPESAADTLIQNLVIHSDYFLFSAAIPNQGGQNHINEQWPEYWEAKFNALGFYFHDIIRPQVWSIDQIEWWYRQNIFIVSRDKSHHKPFGSLSVVHPMLLNRVNTDRSEYYESLVTGKQGLRLACKVFINSIGYKIGRWFGMRN